MREPCFLRVTEVTVTDQNTTKVLDLSKICQKTKEDITNIQSFKKKLFHCHVFFPSLFLIHTVSGKIEIKVSLQSHPDFKRFSFLDIGCFSAVAFHRLGKVYYQLPTKEAK